MHSHGCEHCLWTDDAQIYVRLQPDLSTDLQTPLSCRLLDILVLLMPPDKPPPQLYQSQLMVSLPLSQCP